MSDIYRAWSYNDAALYHHGIKGMKWGIRRYQNKDGTLTAEGKKRYGTPEKMYYERARKAEENIDKAGFVALGGMTTALGAHTATIALGHSIVASSIAGPIGGAICGGAMLGAFYNAGKAELNLRKYAKLKNLPMRSYMTTTKPTGKPNGYVFDENGEVRDLYYSYN